MSHQCMNQIDNTAEYYTKVRIYSLGFQTNSEFDPLQWSIVPDMLGSNYFQRWVPVVVILVDVPGEAKVTNLDSPLGRVSWGDQTVPGR